MEVHHFVQVLLIILITARVFAELATRLKAPSVIGELVAGVVLGPSLMGWVEPYEAIKLLAEIGIILLLFEVGLDTDLKQLAESGWQSVLVAVGGFVFPFLLGFAVSNYLFGLSVLVSLFIGGTLTATSIGITVRVLTDLHIHHGKEGQIVLGAAVLDDIFGVILLALLYEFATGGGVSLANTGKVMAFISIFFITAPVAAKLISHVIGEFEHRTEIPGLIPVMMVSLVLLFAWLAKEVGAPEMLGGFAAGLALSRRFFLPLGIALHGDPAFAHKIEVQIRPIVYLFTPIFFVTVGLSLNLKEVDWGSYHIWGLSLALLVVAVAGKSAGALVIRENWPSRVAISIAMVPRGEVGLIFAELGRSSGVFDSETYAALIIVIALTTLVSPIVLEWYLERHSDELIHEARASAPPVEE